MSGQITHEQARQHALDDVEDIDALAKSHPFNRYFVRKLNTLYKDALATSLTGKTPEDRERGRHRANLLNELAEMPANDRQTAEKFLRSPDPVKSGPTQVG